MVKVLAILTSPHADSTTAKVLNAVLEGCKEKGAEVELVHLKDVKPCRDCRACNKLGCGKCATQDDMTALYPKILAADVLVHACPVYFFGVNGVMKCYLERLTPFYDPDWTPLPEAHFNSKKCITVITSGDESCGPASYGPIKTTMEYSGVKNLGVVYATPDNYKSKLGEAKKLGMSI